jgi:SAM-dependent methyltransferase
MLPFALTIFTGAFLLFQVQPLIGKFILPWFGGSPGVWTTCMLFFQVLLLGGYAYAHWVSRLPTRKQCVIHGVLLLCALATLPITPGDSWKPAALDNPTGHILLLLLATIGLPYLAVSSTGPLMQSWFTRVRPGESPYRLYALSNVGSLLALVSYPFYFEPEFTRRTQAGMWGWGLVAYVGLTAWCISKLWKFAPPASAPAAAVPAEEPAKAGNPTPGRMSLWLLLPACASLLLVATTNKMCLDVGVIPFLWVLPLALYLLTFILAFDHPRWYSRTVFGFAFPLCAGAAAWVLHGGVDVPIVTQVVANAASLFVCGMLCHGELFRLKPHPRHLTRYFLMIATGGALGGFLVAVVAPRAFNDYHELPIGQWLCGALVAWLGWRARDHKLAAALAIGAVISAWASPWTTHTSRVEWMDIFRNHRAWWIAGTVVVFAAFVNFRRVVAQEWTWRSGVAVGAFVVALGFGFVSAQRASGGNVVFAGRNFYGVLKVLEFGEKKSSSHYYSMLHGRITHGLQMTDPAYEAMPVSYFGPGSGVSIAVNALPTDSPRHIGVLGLGAGTLTSFGRAGDKVRVYEINPQVRDIARSHFTYLKLCKADLQLVMGDARLSMEHEPPQEFDILVMDAFSSDAVPVHLVTREAIEIYLRHLKPTGVLAIHVSNRFLDLQPVVEELARDAKLKVLGISDDFIEEEWFYYESSFILLGRPGSVIESPSITNRANMTPRKPGKIRLWTDDYASMLPILQK